MIVDLRNNGGGYFHIAIKLVNEFFDDQRIVVYTQGAHEERVDYFSDGNGNYTQGGLAILVNEATASASEVVAGAVQDWERGILIGRRTYGKATVQELFDFSDGSRINLSIARYYTPLGRSIQRSYLPNWADISAQRPFTEQLWSLDTTYHQSMPVETASGRVLYSAGGIVPDVRVPIDSNATSILYQQLAKSNLVEQFVYGRFSQKLPAYSIENFLHGYTLPDTEYEAFMEFLAGHGLEVSQRKQKDLHELIQSDIEALLGRFYFGREAYFKVKNRDDDFVEQALLALGVKSEEADAQQQEDNR